MSGKTCAHLLLENLYGSGQTQPKMEANSIRLLLDSYHKLSLNKVCARLILETKYKQQFATLSVKTNTNNSRFLFQKSESRRRLSVEAKPGLPNFVRREVMQWTFLFK